MGVNVGDKVMPWMCVGTQGVFPKQLLDWTCGPLIGTNGTVGLTMWVAGNGVTGRPGIAKDSQVGPVQLMDGVCGRLIETNGTVGFPTFTVPGTCVGAH